MNVSLGYWPLKANPWTQGFDLLIGGILEMLKRPFLVFDEGIFFDHTKVPVENFFKNNHSSFRVMEH